MCRETLLSANVCIVLGRQTEAEPRHVWSLAFCVEYPPHAQGLISLFAQFTE